MFALPVLIYWRENCTLLTQRTRRIQTAEIMFLILLTEYCAGGKIEKNEMGGACGAYGAGERGVQGSGGET